MSVWYFTTLESKLERPLTSSPCEKAPVNTVDHVQMGLQEARASSED